MSVRLRGSRGALGPALALAALLAVAPDRALGQGGAAPTVRAIIAAAQHPWARWPDFSPSADVVGRLYLPRGAAPLWLDSAGATPAARGAISQLLAAADHGLDPSNYDAAVLDSVAGRLLRLPADQRARFDVLLTVDLIRFLDDVQHGRLRDHPLSAMSGAAGPDMVALISKTVAGDSLPRIVSAIEPQLAQYRMLREALARYRALAADTSLGKLPRDQFVWPGSSYDHLARLRRTLTALGDLSPDTAATGNRYQGAVVAAVRRFQQRHALPPDGVLGPGTLAALDAPASDGVQRIELALERLRWIPPIGTGRLLVVNIPAFQLVGLESASRAAPPALSMRVVVGNSLDRHTPLLFERLRYVEFLPYWNVPRSIVVREILPLLEADSRYLRSRDMEIVTARGRVLGDSVSPSLMSRLRLGQLRIRQRPGPSNALGLAKFIFPNDSSVYLHDTPRKDLFAEDERALSHGCISVENPAALAVWVLRRNRGWNREAVEAAMAGPRTRRVLLSEPVPVLVFYTTAVAHADGSVWFYPDVYGHDARTKQALQSPSALSSAHDATTNTDGPATADPPAAADR